MVGAFAIHGHSGFLMCPQIKTNEPVREISVKRASCLLPVRLCSGSHISSSPPQFDHDVTGKPVARKYFVIHRLPIDQSFRSSVPFQLVFTTSHMSLSNNSFLKQKSVSTSAKKKESPAFLSEDTLLFLLQKSCRVFFPNKTVTRIHFSPH